MDTAWTNEKKNTLWNQEANQSTELNLQVKSHRKVSVLIHFLHTKHCGKVLYPTNRIKLFLSFYIKPKDTGCIHQIVYFLYSDLKLIMNWLKIIFSKEITEYLQCPNTLCKVQVTCKQCTGIFPRNHYNVRMDKRNIKCYCLIKKVKLVSEERQLYFSKNHITYSFLRLTCFDCEK